MNINSKALAILSIKYIPVLGSAIMIAHLSFALHGYYFKFSEFAFSMAVFPTILILLCSHIFGFCLLHKSFTVYVLAVSSCMSYHREYGFDEQTLFYVRIVLFSIGLALFILLHFKNNCFKQKIELYDKKDTE